MFLLKIIAIFIIVLIIGFIINGIEDFIKDSNRTAISFKESMDLINVPIVTFLNNHVKLHFLLDTGSDSSFIRKDALKLLLYKKTDVTEGSIMTGAGEAVSLGKATLKITYKKQEFEDEFEITDLLQMWDDSTNPLGITVHGILGSRFFNKYKYQIDFNEMIAYSKK